MSREIKNTLFRFATMRAPELLDIESESGKFIKHIHLSDSVFINEINKISKSSERKTTLRSASDDFQPNSFKIRQDIKNEVGDSFYAFAVWLIQNRITLDIETTDNKIKGLKALTKAQLVIIWDNLFYQIITYNSGPVREMLFTVLIANHFIDNLSKTEKTEKAYKKLAQTRIVVPTNLFELETNFGSAKNSNSLNTKSLDKELNTIVLNDKLQYLNKVKKDVEKLKKTYKKEQRIARNIAFENYKNIVKGLNDGAKSTEQEYIDPELKITRKFISYDPVEIPDFKFEPAIEIDAKTQAKLVSNETQVFINEIIDAEGYTTYDEVIDYVDNEINTTTETLFEEVTLEDTVVNYNGTLVPISNEVPTGAMFSVSGSHITPTTLLFNTDFLNAHVISASYQITFIASGETVSGSTFLDTIINNKLSVKIFTNNEVSFSSKGSFRITGEFVLNNNRKVTITGTGRTLSAFPPTIITSGYHIFGNGSYTIEILSDDGTDTDTNTDSGSVEYIPSGYGIKRLGIADYRKVEQTVCCYVPGEVSHIENIMAREYKDKETRRLRRKEDITTTLKETETESLTDTTTTDRFEMNQETASILAEDQQMGVSVNASYSQGSQETGLYGLNAGADFSTATSSEESNIQAVTYAKDVTERALDRVVQKTKEERTVKIIEEFEEKNTHGFDNRKGENHISGVYRWIDKIYKNQVINYGKRLMYEFMIPEPAAFHNIAIEGVSNTSDETLVKPKDPRTEEILNLKDYTEITQETYAHWAGLYNAEVDAAPKQNILVGESFNINGTSSFRLDHTESVSGNGKIRIPEGYKATRVTGTFNASSDHDTQGNILSLTIGNVTDKYTGRFYQYTLELDDDLDGEGFIGEIPVSYTLGNHVSGDINAVVYCSLTTQAERQWKIETFNAIITAYENKLAEYNSRASEIKDFGVNPGFFRQIENNVLRKNCIEYLASHANVGESFILDRTEVQNTRADYENAELETYAARVKFFEQAFEWSIISYNFYPFYWADKSKWKSLYNVTEFNDPLHRAFLQSGMARVVVTVKPGFEEVVNWYMATGQIWNGGQVPTMDDELFLSIVDELQEPEGVVEETWETRVPTSLTVIQAGSIGLNVEGLPCNSDCNDFKLFDSDNNEILDAEGNSFTNPLQQTNAQIGESEEEETTEEETTP